MVNRSSIRKDQFRLLPLGGRSTSVYHLILITILIARNSPFIEFFRYPRLLDTDAKAMVWRTFSMETGYV